MTNNETHKKTNRQPKKQLSKKTSQHEEGIYSINKDKLSIGTGTEKQKIRQTSKKEDLTT